MNTLYSYYGPSWSPNNGSIAFMQTQGTINNAIKAIDVSVNSSGQAVGSNARTIYQIPTTEADNAQTVAWSNTTTMNKIAFCTRELADSRRTVWVVSANGGTPVKVWECDSSFIKEDGSVVGHQMPIGWAVWSPDDSRLAFERLDSGTRTNYTTAGTQKAVTIMIFSTTDNGATWTYTDSIKHSSTGAYAYYPDIQWSNGTLNKLALWDYEDGKLYYANPSSSTSITTDGIPGGGLSWSPNNSSILHCSNAYVWKSVPFTTTTTPTSANPSYGGRMQIRWKH